MDEDRAKGRVFIVKRYRYAAWKAGMGLVDYPQEAGVGRDGVVDVEVSRRHGAGEHGVDSASHSGGPDEIEQENLTEGCSADVVGHTRVEETDAPPCGSMQTIPSVGGTEVFIIETTEENVADPVVMAVKKAKVIDKKLAGIKAERSIDLKRSPSLAEALSFECVDDEGLLACKSGVAQEFAKFPGVIANKHISLLWRLMEQFHPHDRKDNKSVKEKTAKMDSGGNFFG